MADEKDNNSNASPNPGKEKAPEVRYVPVEYIPHSDEESEIDLIALAQNIWEGRWTIAKIAGVFVVIGLFFAIFSPVLYESEAIMIPEVEHQQDRAGQLLQQFGGAFGLGGSLPQMEAPQGAIPPMVYPRIVNSLSFQMELMGRPIRFEDYGVTTTIPDFYENHYSPSLTEWIWKLTIKLPYTLLDLIREDEVRDYMLEEDPFQAEFIQVTKKELELIDEIRDRISVNLAQETGLLTTRVNLHDARASAELNRHLIELLKKYVTEYRVEKVRQDLEFVEEQQSNSRERFEETQLNLAEFRDQNVSLATARARTELERLQDEKNLAFNLYSSLSQQLEEARLRLQEQKPVFSVVQAVNVPSDKSSPRRGIIVLTFLFLGTFIPIIYLVFSFLIKNNNK